MNDSPAPRDARVAAAISHWGARFVANGVTLTDFEEVTASIAAWDDWCGAWSARAAVHERLGREALDNERSLSAGEHLQRAGGRMPEVGPAAPRPGRPAGRDPVCRQAPLRNPAQTARHRAAAGRRHGH